MSEIERKQRQKLAALIVGVTVGTVLIIVGVAMYLNQRQDLAPQPGSAANELRGKIEAGVSQFFDGGAKGYLFWQFSGSPGQGIANDPFSFYKTDGNGQAVCGAAINLKQKYPDRYLGVNMWDIGRHDKSIVKNNFRWLAACKLNVVRIFAGTYINDTNSAKNHVANALAAANEVNQEEGLTGDSAIKILVVVGDYSNGGGGVPKGAPASFYAGDQAEQVAFTDAILTVSSKNTALFGYEIANEAHCQGQTAPMEDYAAWAKKFATKLQTGSSKVGIGQMANFSQPSCDTPFTNDQVSKSGFELSNEAAEITMTSGHFYTSGEKANVIKAMEAAVEFDKDFYIGEASVDGTILGVTAGSGTPDPVLPDLDDSTDPDGGTDEPDDGTDEPGGGTDDPDGGVGTGDPPPDTVVPDNEVATSCEEVYVHMSNYPGYTKGIRELTWAGPITSKEFSATGSLRQYTPGCRKVSNDENPGPWLLMIYHGDPPTILESGAIAISEYALGQLSAPINQAPPQGTYYTATCVQVGEVVFGKDYKVDRNLSDLVPRKACAGVKIHAKAPSTPRPSTPGTPRPSTPELPRTGLDAGQISMLTGIAVLSLGIVLWVKYRPVKPSR